jgi:predicted secreted protein
MAASTAEAAYGTTIAYTDGAAETIGEVTNISGLSLAVDTIDVTSHDSDNAYKEFVAGLIEPGEVTIEGNHIPADTGQVAILTHLNARTVRALLITYPDASNWAFSAACTAYSAADAAVDGKLSFSATFKVSGVPLLSYS